MQKLRAVVILAVVLAMAGMLTLSQTPLSAQQGVGGAPPTAVGGQGGGPGAQGGAGGGRGGGGGLANKNPALPAGAFTAGSTVAHTMIQHEWVDIPFAGQPIHTWIEYPNGSR